MYIGNIKGEPKGNYGVINLGTFKPNLKIDLDYYITCLSVDERIT
jgi:hypothetical protein